MEINHTELRDIKKMLTEIHHVVIGSEHDEESGLLSRVRNLETDVESQIKLFDRVKYLIIGISVPASWGIIDILRAIFQKH